MISAFLAKVGAAILAPLVFLTTVFAPTPAPEPVGVALPSATAVFETSLAAPITAAATSMTLSSNSVRGGGTLSGYQCFTIDEGSAQAEYVCGTVSGTTVSSLERGLSPLNGTTTVASLSFSHRRGASVKITAFPVLQRLVLQSTGTGTYESALRYATSVSTTTLSTDGQNLASVAYANYLSFGGVAAASETTAGFGELATGIEAASSTQTGSAGRLVLPASIATSTAPASGNVIPVTRIDGRLDGSFCCSGGTTTFSGGLVGAGNAPSTSVFSSVGTTTYTKPANLRWLSVRVVGAGSGGSGADTDDTFGVGTAGASGGYAEKTYLASQLPATTSVVVGAGGGAGSTSATPSSGNSGNPSKFYLILASGGVGGSLLTSTGGTASGGDVNIDGRGWATQPANPAPVTIGGSTPLGNGGMSSPSAGSQSCTGYGGGGHGAQESGSVSAGAGCNGVVIITEYF